jgi:hypothetical protein
MKTPRPKNAAPMLTPMLMAGLVLALPLAATSPAAAMPARATVVAGVTGVTGLSGSQERAEYLARCVSEAARQFCAVHVTPMFCDAGLALDAPEATGLIAAHDDTATRLCLTHVTLIDLPPPTC